MQEELIEENKEGHHLLAQEFNEDSVESVTLVLPDIEDPIVIGWSLLNSEFLRFLQEGGLEESVAIMQKIINNEI